ncbi:MAG: U32 family peptidase [Selenomonadaceae bacterium]|nr:U32 family peptidase [Selenomonadaceae bacterium]
MTLSKKSVELLAPAGTWDAFTAAIDAGADAVYLGGKHFNMRVHKNDFNLTDDELKDAVNFAHQHEKKIYITLNNLISSEEIPPLKNYLQFLEKIQPDALIVQDLSVIHLINELNLKLPIHASVMMNINNISAVKFLQNLGVKRIVLGRELSLKDVSLIKEKTDIEVEYFVHGDMCIAVSGQCNHSGVIFGQSGSRGRCFKPCRWKWKFIDEETHEILDDFSHKTALNDMCMIRNIPDMIQAGVNSFKIEGRMRPPEFISRITSAYRKIIDDYIADPTGFSIDEDFWKDFYEKRVRNFTTTFAFAPPTKNDIGLSGKREPRFFSAGVIEKSYDDDEVKNIFNEEKPIKKFENKPSLNVRVSTLDSAKSAVENGANLIYVGGEIFRPNKPFTLKDFKSAVNFAHEHGAKIILNTPRVTRDKFLNELREFLKKLDGINFDGVLVSNLGTLNLMKNFNLPIYADISFNLFNEISAEFLKNQGIVQAAASIELSFAQVKSIVEKSNLPIEIIVHGSNESMICEHNFIKLYHPNYDDFATPELLNKHFALEDSAGEIHPLRVDQFGYNHIYFAKDLCLLPYLEKFLGAAALRIDAQDYSTEVTALTTKIYRDAIDGKSYEKDFEELKKIAPRRFGCGVYRFKQSKNSID